MIWVGQFDSEADFEKYMDQSAFRQWWKDYDEDFLRKRPKNCLKNTFRDTKRKSIKQNLERKLTLVESTIKINFQR